MTRSKSATLWRGIRLSGKALLWIGGSLVLAAGMSWLGIRYAGSMAAFRLWLEDATPWLQLWRLALYALIAGLWFHRVRQWLLQQTGNLAAIRRIEWLTAGMMLTIELINHAGRWA